MANPRSLEQILGRPDLTPLRYPGGKRKLALAVAGMLEHTGGPIELLVEPFAGGAAVSLALLEAGRVQSIALSDLDTLVGSFWQVVFSAEAPALAEQVARADITLKVWEELRAKAKAEAFETALERAYACLFLNRTSFSGILHKKAGPIGGRAQSGKYKLDCRFNRSVLSARILELGKLRHRVKFARCQDYQRSLSQVRQTHLAQQHPERIAWYLDPPFFEKAETLYRRTFDQAAHQKLKDTVFTLPGHWILSYDNVERARALYGSYAGFSTTALLYSARIDSIRRDSGDEIVVSNILETLRLERARQANLSSLTNSKRTAKTKSKLLFEHAPLATLI